MELEGKKEGLQTVEVDQKALSMERASKLALLVRDMNYHPLDFFQIDRPVPCFI